MLRVYSINPKDKKQAAFYESTLYPQDKAAPDKCAARTIIYTVLLASGIVSSHVQKFLTGGKYPKEIILDAKNSRYLRSKD